MNTVHSEIQRELSSGEKVLWSGQPRRGLVLRGSDLFVVPFSLLWCGFAIFWELTVLRAPGAPTLFIFWGIPFVCIGLYIVVGRFFVDAVQRRNTFYAVTDERVLIVSGVFSRKVKSLGLRALAELSLTQRRNGEGTISFGGTARFRPMLVGLAAWPGVAAQAGPSFDVVARAKSVFEIIRHAQRSLS